MEMYKGLVVAFVLCISALISAVPANVIVSSSSLSLRLPGFPPDVPLPTDSGFPFITFFGDESYKGDYYHHFLKQECSNIPSQYKDWASSVNIYGRCIHLCAARNCAEGSCKRIHGERVERLKMLGLNDKVSSVKFCYTFAERGK